MEGDDQKYEDPCMNVNSDVNPSSKYCLSKSRNLFRQKDPQPLADLSSGKWLQIVKNSPKVRENCADESRIPSYQSEKMNEKVISLSSKTFLAPSLDISQGTLQFTMRANGAPRFAFKLENQKHIYYVANVHDQTVLDYSYMVHLQRGESLSSQLVGRIKFSTLSSLNERIIEREFVLFSSNNSEHPQMLPCRKKNRGLSKKVVDVIKKNQSISRSTCSWDQQFQEPRFGNNLAPNLETLAVVVKQELLEDETGGWGMKFLKKSKTESERSRCLVSMDVVVPSGIHGGPEDGPSSLIDRWKSQGNCDCGGWDLGCSLTLLKGKPQKDHRSLFELFIEGSKQEMPGLRIVNVGIGLYSVQFQTNFSVLQSFTIALAFIHSQYKELLSFHP